MDAIVERLRASKERTENEIKVAGHLAGCEWATGDAEYEELKRLADWDRSSCGEGFALEAFAVIKNDGRPLENDCNDFWESCADILDPPDEYARAFVEGAVEIYELVAGKL